MHKTYSLDNIIFTDIRLIDPAKDLDETTNLVIKDAKVEAISKDKRSLLNAYGTESKVIDASNLCLCPGLVDVHTHFRDPGFPEKETLDSGAEAGLAGGYTHLIAMANTKPAMDNPQAIANFYERAQELPLHIYTMSALSKDLKGKELVDMTANAKAGAVGFSDDGSPIADEKLFLKALKNAKNLDLPLSLHEEYPAFVENPGVNAGPIAEKLGLKGASKLAEEYLVARDGVLALNTGTKVDFEHISTAVASHLIKLYKEQGANIVAEITPHHFSLTEETVLEKGTMAKMNPPLRSIEDLEAIHKGLREGQISIIATDHAPHTQVEKDQDFTKAPSGIVGLETALALTITNLVKPGILSLKDALAKLTINPAKFYNLDAGVIEIAKPADICIFDPKESWTVKAENFYSKSQNSPFIGEKLQGKVKAVYCLGKLHVFD